MHDDVDAAEQVARRCGLDFDDACELVRDTPWSGFHGTPAHVAALEITDAERLLDDREHALMSLEAASEGGSVPDWAAEIATRTGQDEREYADRARSNLQRERDALHADLMALARAGFDATQVWCPPTGSAGRLGPYRRFAAAGALIRPRSARATIRRSRPARRSGGVRAGPSSDDGPPAPAVGHRHECRAVVA